MEFDCTLLFYASARDNFVDCPSLPTLNLQVAQCSGTIFFISSCYPLILLFMQERWRFPTHPFRVRVPIVFSFAKILIFFSTWFFDLSWNGLPPGASENTPFLSSSLFPPHYVIIVTPGCPLATLPPRALLLYELILCSECQSPDCLWSFPRFRLFLMCMFRKLSFALPLKLPYYRRPTLPGTRSSLNVSPSSLTERFPKTDEFLPSPSHVCFKIDRQMATLPSSSIFPFSSFFFFLSLSVVVLPMAFLVTDR